MYADSAGGGSSSDCIENQYSRDQDASFRIAGNGAIAGSLAIGTATPAGPLDVQGKIMEYGSPVLPRGVIVMWHGSVSDIPSGWALCNGGTYIAPDGSSVVTPDLRNRFIVAAGGSYSAGNRGGSSNHSHSVNIPSFSSSYVGNHSHWVDPPSTSTSSVGNHSHRVDPPSTSTSYVGNHSHSYSGHTQSSSDMGCNYYSYYPDGYNDICDNHTHYYSGSTNGSGGHSHSVNIGAFWSDGAGGHSHSVNIPGFSSSGSGGHSHSIDPPPTSTNSTSNIPPYYALVFIMKL